MKIHLLDILSAGWKPVALVVLETVILAGLLPGLMRVLEVSEGVDEINRAYSFRQHPQIANGCSGEHCKRLPWRRDVQVAAVVADDPRHGWAAWIPHASGGNCRDTLRSILSGSPWAETRLRGLRA